MVPVFFLASVLASMVEPSIDERVQVQPYYSLWPAAEARGKASGALAAFGVAHPYVRCKIDHLETAGLDINQGWHERLLQVSVSGRAGALDLRLFPARRARRRLAVMECVP